MCVFTEGEARRATFHGNVAHDLWRAPFQSVLQNTMNPGSLLTPGQTCGDILQFEPFEICDVIDAWQSPAFTTLKHFDGETVW